MSNRWFPGANLDHKAPVDGGSILGGRPKMLWHSTESSGLPSYSTGYFPNMTLDPGSGRVWQHIPADRAARALRNPAGGAQTNRWCVLQIEVIGYANRIPFHPVMAEVARWGRDHLGVPLTEGVDWLPYPSSYGNTRVRLSGAEWANYSGHLAHQHAPENDHGDTGWPFPIQQILAGEEDDMAYSEDDLRRFIREEVRKALGSTLPRDFQSGSVTSIMKDIQGGVDRTEPKVDQLLAQGTPQDPPAWPQ